VSFSFVKLFGEWIFYPTMGNSGGILSILCNANIKPFSPFEVDFLGVCIDWNASDNYWFMVNIYASALGWRT